MKKRLSKRLISLILTICLLMSLAAPALAFTNAGSWAQNELNEAQQAGILPDAMLNADMAQSMSRQEMCDLAVHTFERLTNTTLYPSSTTHFSDTSDANISIAFELGIVDGYPDGTFRPAQNLTREEFSRILTNLFASLGWSEASSSLAVFSDQASISAWAREAVATVVELGIIRGNNDGTIAPTSYGSCEQALTMLLRTHEFLSNYLQTSPTDNTIQREQHNTAAQTNDLTTVSDLLNIETPASGQARLANGYTCSNWAVSSMSAMAALECIPDSLKTADLTKAITRGQLCQAAVYVYENLTGTTVAPKATNHFTDTSDEIFNAAYELGIINGFPDGTFRPEEFLTRQQLFTILTNLLELAGWEKEADSTVLNSAFSDASQIGAWALESVRLMHQLEIIRGNANGTFAPKKNTSRQEAIVMFLRGYTYIKDWYKANPLPQITGPIVANSKAQAVVEMALTYVGYPYSYGHASPAEGFDCSGFTWYIYKQFGYTLNRTAAGQISNGINVNRDQMMPGDIIIMSVAGDINTVGHVAIYIGNGNMVHAQSSSTGVCITPVANYNARYITARRIIY